MNRKVVSVTPETTLEDVINTLFKHQISNVPVVAEHKPHPILVGFVSEADCLEQLSEEVFYGSPMPPQSAATIMKKHPVCVDPETELFSLASVFVDHGLRHLPVVENHELLGIVSRRDILKALNDYYRNQTAEHISERFPPDLSKLINLRFIMRN